MRSIKAALDEKQPSPGLGALSGLTFALGFSTKYLYLPLAALGVSLLRDRRAFLWAGVQMGEYSGAAAKPFRTHHNALDIDLSDMQPDFFTGSAHKWPCGPREVGVLYIRRDALSKISPSIVSLYAGAVGASTTFEGMGQRDDAAVIAFGEALKLQIAEAMSRLPVSSRGSEPCR